IEHRYNAPLKVRQDGRDILKRYLLPTLRVRVKAHLGKPQTGAWPWTAVIRQAHHEVLVVSLAPQDFAFPPRVESAWTVLGEDPEFTPNQGVVLHHACLNP